MEIYIKYLIVFFLQFFYNLLRIQEIKLTYENKVVKLMINTVLMNLIVLASTYYSLSMLLSGNWFVGVVYILGAVLGKWIGMQKSTNYRKIILDKIKDK
jgi:hypothetical protein